MTYVERMMNGEDFNAELCADWGPDTEMGKPVALKINVELSHKDGKPDYCLSIMGDLRIKESKKLGLHGIHVSWQCREVGDILDENGLKCHGLDVIVPIWNKWHNNELTAGTDAQEACLDRYRAENPGWRYDYDEACLILKDNCLLTDKDYKVDGKPYKYGTRWLFRKIPQEVLVDLCNVLDEGISIVKKGEE